MYDLTDRKNDLMNVQYTVSPNGSTESISGHFKQDVGLYLFKLWMAAFAWTSSLSPWLFSNMAALTVSCFEIRKHVIHSLTLTAAIRDSRPFNIPLSLNVLTPGGGSSLHNHLQQWVKTQFRLVEDERLVWVREKNKFWMYTLSCLHFLFLSSFYHQKLTVFSTLNRKRIMEGIIGF